MNRSQEWELGLHLIAIFTSIPFLFLRVTTLFPFLSHSLRKIIMGIINVKIYVLNFSHTLIILYPLACSLLWDSPAVCCYDTYYPSEGKHWQQQLQAADKPRGHWVKLCLSELARILISHLQTCKEMYSCVRMSCPNGCFRHFDIWILIHLF